MENTNVISYLRLGILTFLLCLLSGLHLESELLSRASTAELLMVLGCFLAPTVPVLVAIRLARKEVEASPVPSL